MIDQIKTLFGSDFDFLEKSEDGCINIHLKSGECIKMYDDPQEVNINIPRCNFCGAPALENVYLFEDNDSFICNHCTSRAVSAFLKSKVNIDIQLEEEFKDCINNLNGLNKK